MKRAILVFLVFVVAGPMIGGLVSVAPGVVSGLLAGELGSPREFLELLVFVGLFAYLLGGLAALLCGLWVAWQAYRGGRPKALVTAGAGFLATLPNVLALGFATAGDSNGPNVFGLFLQLGFVGALSGAVCLWLCRRLGLVAAPG